MQLCVRWEARRKKLTDQIWDLDPDIVSLVISSADGCGIFWRRSKFQMVASEAGDKGREKRDRSCLMVLLRWKNAPHTLPLVVVSTHLAKEFWCLWLVCPFHSAGPLQQSPDSHPCQTGRTGRCVNMLSAAFWQVTQIMASLTAFTTTHDARSLGCGLCLRMLAPWNFLFFRGQRLSCGAVGGPQCTPLWRDPRVWALG
ncbi:unnamed protein product [Effrenium voratum]|nr:unnamed protein product [Effrenium voratum]